jgi:thiamine pyrophosphokinase
MVTEKTALVILNGDPPGADLLDYFWDRSKLVICADGAAQTLYKVRKTPDLILGDFDSIPHHLLKVFNKSKLQKISNQDTTDGEKALLYCEEQGLKQVNVLGAFGGRLDHSLYNIELLKKLQTSGLSIVCYSEKEKIYLADGIVQLTEKPGTRISLFPVFGPLSEVSSEGLKWELEGATLDFGRFSSISNQIIHSPASISIPDGFLLVIMEHNLFKQGLAG